MYIISTLLMATLTMSNGPAPDNQLLSQGKAVQNNLYSHCLGIVLFKTDCVSTA